MNLGEQIYALRTERNLSQGDLADALDVSRQSISKWENNNSVPDLDKLVKLSTLFGVSLDELVKGEKTAQPEPTEPPKSEPEPQPNSKETGFPPRKIAGIIGIILLSMGFVVLLVLGILVGLGGGFLCSAPFFLCGIVCFLFRKRTALWCVWVLALLLDVYIRWITGQYGRFAHIPEILRGMISGVGVKPWNILSLVMLILLCTLVIATAICFRKRPLVKKFRFGQNSVDLSTWHLGSVILWWAVVAVWFAVGPIGLGSVELPVMLDWYVASLVITDWSWLVSLTSALTFTLRYIHTYRRQKANS